jgi:TolA-binding protein
VNEETTCSIVDRPALAEQYVARRMPEAERVAFEDHFVTCADCQREVRFADAVRANLREPGAARESAHTRSRTHIWRWTGGGLALAAGIAAFAIIRMQPSAGFAELGGVREPPVYLGVAVRGTPGPADSVFEHAMNEYAARNYSAAAAGLRAALAAGQDSVPTEFFLGASLLMSNDARGAAEAFGRVVGKGDSPYLDEAQLFQAKALLRLGRGREARDVLARHRPTDPVLAKTLAALSDSIARAMDR